MVIQVQPSSHGPHIWWPALLFCREGMFIDFFRYEYPFESPDGVGRRRDHNTYVFTKV